MSKLLNVLALMFAMALCLPAQALDLQEAKSAGWVGEQRDGYLGLVSAAAPPAARDLVTRVNGERRSHYRQIATRNQVDLRTVELLAAEKALQKTPAGQYIQGQGGEWVKK